MQSKFVLSFAAKTRFKNALLYSLCALWLSLTFSKALTEIFFVASLVLWGGGRLFRVFDYKFLIPRSAWVPLALFAAAVVASCFFSEIPKNSLRGISKIAQQLSIFFMAADFFREESYRRKFEKFFLVSIWLVALNGLCQYTLGRDFLRWKTAEPSGAGVRVSASFGTYGIFASFLIMTIPYAFSCALYFKKRFNDLSRHYLFLIVGCQMLLLLFLTRSRGALLSVFAGCTFILLMKRKFIVLLLFFAAGAAFVAALPRNMTIHLDADLKEQSIVERFYLWDRAIHVIRAKPLLGTGINTYADAHSKYDKTQNWRVRNYYAHNGYLQLAAEIGLPGLVVFLWFLLSYFSTVFRSPQNKGVEGVLILGLTLGSLNFLAFTMVDTVFQSPLPVKTFWFLMGLNLAYILSFISSRSNQESLDCPPRKGYSLAS